MLLWHLDTPWIHRTCRGNKSGRKPHFNNVFKGRSRHALTPPPDWQWICRSHSEPSPCLFFTNFTPTLRVWKWLFFSHNTQLYFCLRNFGIFELGNNLLLNHVAHTLISYELDFNKDLTKPILFTTVQCHFQSCRGDIEERLSVRKSRF